MVATQVNVTRIEVHPKEAKRRPLEGFEQISADSSRLYFLQGALDSGEIDQLCQELLADPVTESYAVQAESDDNGAAHVVEVALLPGVTDPAAENLLRAAKLLGISGLERAATGMCHYLYGEIDSVTLHEIATKVLSNPVIQRAAIDEAVSAPFVAVQAASNAVEVIPLKDVDDEQLKAISAERRLSLDLDEMRAIRDYFAEAAREPTDAELEMLAQTWSEHCVHKTFKAKVTYTGPAHGAPADSEPVIQEVDGILKTYIRAATEMVNKPWVRSAFVDNAGIVRFDDQYDLAFKAETHNRPSAIEPFGGANTGVGGAIRDVLGVSAKPIANTDILFFGPPDMNSDELPEGVLHPKRVAQGVVAGIEDYGNKMGIPTVNGAIYYDRRYTSNPLVFCGCVGILPHGAHRTEAQSGDLIVVIGGRTGRDGLRGATFSSMEMDMTTAQVSGGAVQIGHPIHEKQTQEVILRARDEGLYTAITDCGAGGLSSAVGEMGEKIGATVQLETVPLKYPGLQPWEIWLSEAQERMVLAVPPENWERLKAIADGQDIDATVIGAFESTGRLTLYYGDKLVGDLKMTFLHDGLPQRHMQAEWSPPADEAASSHLPADEDLSATLLKLLAMPTIRSKEEVIRRYDHEVQGQTSVKPLVGVDNHGPGDAAVLVPAGQNESDAKSGPKAVALSVGLCPQYTDLDPYAMAWAAVDEAIRNLVATGADPDQIAILDNFSWGNTSMPDRMGSLVRSAQGCYDAALAYDVPFISGKDSLNNEYLGEDGQRHAIPGTLVISGMGIVPDVAKTVTMDLKAPGNLLYVIGETRSEMGDSHYHLLHKVGGGTVPQPVPDALATYRQFYRAVQVGLVQACHDASEGGLAVALAEMCIAGRCGARIDLATDDLDATRLLFSESGGRLVVEIKAEDAATFETLFDGHPLAKIGTVTSDEIITMAVNGAEAVASSVSELERAWRGQEARTRPALAAIPPEGLQTQTLRPVRDRIPARAYEGKPQVIILHANGTNRDHDAALACELAGGQAEIVHINQLAGGERNLLDYHMLVVPGGFSYGDDLGAGVLWALDLRERFKHELDRFVAEGRPVLGICNGFQTLVKADILPGKGWRDDNKRAVTLTYNAQQVFECRWVWLQPNPNSPCLFTQGLDEPLYVPVAHGEGRVMARDQGVLNGMWMQGLATLTYTDPGGMPGGYPWNPNGSALDIAGLCSPKGNVLGLMPHPENHIFPWQHPRYHRGERGNMGLKLFENGIKFA